MKRHTLTALAVLILSLPVLADEPIMDLNASAANLQSHEQEFSLDAETELTLTVGCRPNTQGSALVSIRFMRFDPEGGGQFEVERYRVDLREASRPSSGKITLPPGRYKIVVRAIRMDYRVRLQNEG